MNMDAKQVHISNFVVHKQPAIAHQEDMHLKPGKNPGYSSVI